MAGGAPLEDAAVGLLDPLLHQRQEVLELLHQPSAFPCGVRPQCFDDSLRLAQLAWVIAISFW